MSNPEATKLLRKHKTGFLHLFKIYPRSELRSAFTIPTIGAVIFLVFKFYSSESIRLDLIGLIDFTISVFPNLLGFLLGGFAIFLGFGDRDFLKSVSTNSFSDDYSLFHKVIFAFTFSLLFQAIALISGFAYYLLSSVYFESIDFLYSYINHIGYALLLIIISISLYSIFQIIMIIFGMAQNYHLNLYLENYKESNSMDQDSITHKKTTSTEEHLF